MIVSEEVVLTQTLAPLPPPLIFGRILKCFDTAVLTFLSSSSEPKITYTCYAIQKLFYLLFASQLILCHYLEDSFTHLMLITAFLSFFYSQISFLYQKCLPLPTT